MKEQTKLYRILRYAYLNRDKTFTNRDVANGLDIINSCQLVNDVTSY